MIGVGGDHVVCCDRHGRIEVNGTALDEPTISSRRRPSQVRFDIVVPAGTLWMLGDHRSRSRDSRDHLGDPGGGLVPERKVIGRADGVASRSRTGAAKTARRASSAARQIRPPRQRGPVGGDPAEAAPADPVGTALGRRPVGRAAGAPSGARTGAGAPPRQTAQTHRGARIPPLIAVVALLIALTLKTFFVQVFVIPSGSMQQTIPIGDRVLVDKLTPWFGSKAAARRRGGLQGPRRLVEERAEDVDPTRITAWSAGQAGLRRSSVCCPPRTSRT